MNTEEKWVLAKKLFFAGWIISLTLYVLEIALLKLRPHEYQNIDNEPWFAMLGAALGSLLMLMGLLIGSRGIGNPLSVRTFFSLLFGFPSSIIVVPLLVITFAIPIAKFLGFGSTSGIVVALILAIGVGIVTFEILRLR